MSLRIAIIGAGMAGVSAGRLLADQGHEVTLLEKSRGCGGRCATRRWAGHIVDHGAQYFTLRHLDFSAAVQQTCGEALCRITAPVLDEQGAPLPDTVRYYHREGNSRVVRSMAGGLTLRTETTVTDVRALLAEYDCVLSTAPLPQTAALFGQTITAEYMPCLTVLLAYRGEPTGLCREAYALSDQTSDLAWSACENHKAGRIGAGCTVMVAQMSEAFSRRHLESPPTDYPGLVRSMVERRWGLSSENFLAALGHRWRYARVAQSHTAPALPDRCFPDLKGQTVVLYFYPKDDTPGCTAQACALRDGWSRIQKKAAVFGVSVDPLKSHAKFIKKHSLPFPLISDETKEIVQSYGVWVEKSMYGKKYLGTERSTVIIGPDGKVKAVLRKVQPAEHLDLVLQALA